MEDPFPLDNRQQATQATGRRAPLLFPYSSCTRQASRSIYYTESSITSPRPGTYCWTIRVRPAEALVPFEHGNQVLHTHQRMRQVPTKGLHMAR